MIETKPKSHRGMSPVASAMISYRDFAEMERARFYQLLNIPREFYQECNSNFQQAMYGNCRSHNQGCQHD